MSVHETFHSPLAHAMADFVSFKRMQGYDYTAQVGVLGMFDRFLADQDCTDGVLRPAHFSRYLETTAELSPGGRAGRLSVARQFSLHLHAHRPESAVAPTGMLPRHCRNTRFRRIGPGQVRDLMDAARRLRPKGSIRPACIRFMVGLLYSTGLRIAEALKLDLGDVDPNRSALFVRRGKFDKDRLVVMSPSTLAALNRWLRLRSRYAPTGPSAPLLVGRPNARLTYQQAHYAFKVLCRHCGLLARPRPRLHDLRHNFACQCIARWREEGKDVQALLPVLANAMGHIDIFATEVYIHIEADTLQLASDSFLNHIERQRENR